MKKLQILALIILVAVLSGCVQVDLEKSYDREGNEIVLPEKIENVITIGASITETLVALGLSDKIVCADTYSKDVEGLMDDVFFCDTFTPDVEKMVELRPDVIIVTGMAKHEGTDVYKPFEDVGITVIYIPTNETIEGIKEDILYIAELFDVTKKGEEIVFEFDEVLKKYEEIGKTIDEGEKKTVYFEIAPAPRMYTFGEGAFLSEMLTLIGAKNIFADEKGWLQISDEQIIAKNPDIIITNISYIDNIVEEIKGRSGWENIDAVKNNEVYRVDTNTTSRPNHYIVKGLSQIAKLIYPEKYQ